MAVEHELLTWNKCIPVSTLGLLLNFVCRRCRVSGTYYFVFHASLEDRLCVLMKLDQTLLTSFCDHRRSRRQVSEQPSLTLTLRSSMSLKVCAPKHQMLLIPGDLGRPGGLRVKGSGGLAGDQRLQRDEREPGWLQPLLRVPASPSLTHRRVTAQSSMLWQHSEAETAGNKCLFIPKLFHLYVIFTCWSFIWPEKVTLWAK